MLRSLLLSWRQPFTCIVRQNRLLPRIYDNDTSAVGQRTSLLHTTSGIGVLDKDNPFKKQIQKQKDKEDAVAPIEEVVVEEFRTGTLYPTLETAGMLVDGMRFDELPIVHVKSTHNNTLITLTCGKGVPITSVTGGSVGFRNAKKGTNLAAQTAAVAVGEKSLSQGLKTVRVSLKGAGPGRMPAMKGLQMAGLTIVSITDATRLPFHGNRPRKQKHR